MAYVDLTDREVEFLRLCVEDLSYSEIADKMFVSRRTVDGYSEDLRRRLKIRSRVGLIRFSIFNKIGVVPIRGSAEVFK